MSANLALIVVPVVAGLVTLLVFGWRHEMNKRKEETERLERIKTARIPEGAAYVSTESNVKEIRRELVGSYMSLAFGTFGANQLGRKLILLAQCGLEKLVGSILVIENDTQLRTQFHQRIPPIFHDRIVYGYSEVYSGGLANQPLHRVLAKIDLWGPPLEQAAAEVIDLHLRRNQSRAPAGILAFVSQGGQGPLGLPVLEQIHDRFEETLCVGFTALPSHERLRGRYPVLKALYEERGVQGWQIVDNLGPDPVTSDYGMVATVVGLAESALHADQGTQPNNAFALALTEEPGAVLVHQTLASNVVGYPFAPDPALPARYYVLKQPVVEQVLKGLHRIEQGRGVWSADLPVGEEGTSTFDIVMVSLGNGDLQEVEDAVVAGLKLRQRTLGFDGHNRDQTISYGQPNYGMQFASVATLIDPVKPLCPVVVVRLTAVRDGAHIVDEIVKVPEDRRLSGAQQPALPGFASRDVQRKRQAN